MSDERLALLAKAYESDVELQSSARYRREAAECLSIVRELQTLRSVPCHMGVSAVGGVKVKSLEWDDEQWPRDAVCLGMLYRIYGGRPAGNFKLLYPDKTEAFFNTIDEAKAAAQADVEQRILSSLSPAEEAEPVAYITHYGNPLLRKDFPDDWIENPAAHGLKPLYTRPSPLAQVTVAPAQDGEVVALCPHCEGSGQVLADFGNDIPSATSCPECTGTGRVASPPVFVPAVDDAMVKQSPADKVFEIYVTSPASGASSELYNHYKRGLAGIMEPNMSAILAHAAWRAGRFRAALSSKGQDNE